MARFLAHRDQRLPVSVQVSHLLCVGRADRVVKSLGDRKCTEHPRQQGSPRQLISTTVGVLTGVVRLVCPRMQSPTSTNTATPFGLGVRLLSWI